MLYINVIETLVVFPNFFCIYGIQHLPLESALYIPIIQHIPNLPTCMSIVYPVSIYLSIHIKLLAYFCILFVFMLKYVFSMCMLKLLFFLFFFLRETFNIYLFVCLDLLNILKKYFSMFKRQLVKHALFHPLYFVSIIFKVSII